MAASLDWLNSKRLLLKDSVQVSWSEEQMLCEARGTPHNPLGDSFAFPSAGACRLKVSHKSQAHIAACSGLDILKVSSNALIEKILE